MLVSYNWLQDFLDLHEDPKVLAEKITRTGIEIASTVHPMAGLKKLVVGHILSCEKHPDSDHLHITRVDVGEEKPLQIVCGAPNVAKGQYVIVALHGARIAGNEKIKRGKIRGVVSEGMICGLQEIGFSDHVVPKKVADGIFAFPEPLEPGNDVYHALGMDDYILDFDITPNRADTSSMEGAAFEVGAIIDQTPKIEECTVKEDGPEWTQSWQGHADLKLAPKYLLRRISNVKLADSPLWLQTRLWNAGIRPINNVVDVTNYVMLLTGQPMHAYDATTFANQTVEVRHGRKGEKLKLISQDEIDIDPDDVVITNGDHIVGLAGVMGGFDSEVNDHTTDVILESAVFDPALIRKAALRHANRTAASARFEKGINWDNTEKAIDIAALMLRNLASGRIDAGILRVNDQPKPLKTIKTTVSHINHVLGTQLTMSEITHIFDRLNLPLKREDDDQIQVTVPNRRWDLFIPADLIEEVARIYGYDNLKSTQPVLPQTHGGYSPAEIKQRRVREVLQQLGLDETINYSLTSTEKAKLFTQDPNPLVTVQWPMNSSRVALRQSLLSGLVDAASYNLARQNSELHLFEQGRVFDHAQGHYQEYEHAAALYVGHTQPTNWQHIDHEVDFYGVKGQVVSLLTALGIKENVSYEAGQIAGMHPTRTAIIKISGVTVGFVGMLLPQYQSQDKALRSAEMYGFELDLEKIMPLMKPGVKAQQAPKFPSIERDLSLILDKKVSNAQIISAIEASAGKYLQQVTVIDHYDGVQIERGKKSLTYKLTFLNKKATLTDDIVNHAMDEVIESLKQQLGAQVR